MSDALTASVSPAATTQATRWLDLTRFVSEWFYQPDLEALRIALAVGRAHAYAGVDPVWLFVVGPSGCGKTALFIRGLEGLDRAIIMGDLTPNTFISGKAKGKSFLASCGTSALLLFKDFTTFLSKRQEDRVAIASQLRELHDGDWSKVTGETRQQHWHGKMTIVAACTPAIERAWATMRDLGERFISVRLHTPPLREVSGSARRQIGYTSRIQSGLKERVATLCKTPVTGELPRVPTRYHSQLDALACMVAQGRQHVTRLSGGKREIVDISPAELPTRLITAMEVIVAASADLAGREPNGDDIRLAVRTAVDSVPPVRWRIIEAIPPSGSIAIADLSELISIPASTIAYHTEELKATGILATDPSMADGFVALSSEFSNLRSEALHLPDYPEPTR